MGSNEHDAHYPANVISAYSRLTIPSSTMLFAKRGSNSLGASLMMIPTRPETSTPAHVPRLLALLKLAVPTELSVYNDSKFATCPNSPNFAHLPRGFLKARVSVVLDADSTHLSTTSGPSRRVFCVAALFLLNRIPELRRATDCLLAVETTTTGATLASEGNPLTTIYEYARSSAALRPYDPKVLHGKVNTKASKTDECLIHYSMLNIYWVQHRSAGRCATANPECFYPVKHKRIKVGGTYYAHHHAGGVPALPILEAQMVATPAAGAATHLHTPVISQAASAGVAS
ncbi:hypothetical protein BC629DRAFT_1434899 [Irpex lacteus]|nr:hypothetical protein BC629DRAFT_1434899 [Irpex lacteus]